MTPEEREELDRLLVRMLKAQRESNDAREAYESAHRRIFAKEYQARRQSRLRIEAEQEAVNR